MLTFSLGIYVLSQLINFRCTDALQCYNCSNIVDTDECLTVTKCLAGQSCYQNKRMSDQTTSLGCIENMQCGVLTNGGAGSLIGRSLGSRQVHDCHECCSTDTCNKNLCNHLKPSVCIDDVKFDCALLNTVVNICQDIQHAKTVCPSFCGLCALVDGNWATWSLWSACDVTCENGTQSRTRTCTDPAPAGGGLDCSGSSIETKTCLKELCPDGGWSDWGQWTTCTVSCGGGIQSRSRTCTNPRPSPLGRNCEGDISENILCNRNTCTPKIAFMARNLVDVSPFAGQTMIFGTTLVNEGNAYNMSTGIFTAPVNGTYSFSTQFCVYSQKKLDVAIVVDGVLYTTTAMMFNHGYDSCNSADAVAVLHTNSKVRVKCTSATIGNIIYEDHVYRINSFSGYLLY